MSWIQEGIGALPNLVRLVSRLLRDPRVPRRRKLFAMAVLAYLVWPIDLIPDKIPVLGQLDDLILLVLALHHLLEGTPDEVVREHWEGSQDALAVVADLVDWGAHRVPWPLRRVVARLIA